MQKNLTQEIIDKVAALLTTETLTLIPLSKASPDDFLALMKDSDCEWLTRQGWPLDPSYFENPKYISDYLAQVDLETNLCGFLIQKKGMEGYIGQFGVKMHPDEELVEIQYVIKASVRGQGLATELAQSIVQKLEEHAADLGIKAITAEVEPDNIASLKVMRHTGLEEATSLSDGTHQDLRDQGKKIVLFKKSLQPPAVAPVVTPRHPTALRLK